MFEKYRCLILADGYYEESHTEGKVKQPFLFEVDGGKPFILAGLWEWWRDPAGGPEAPALESCSLITADAKEVGADVRDRVPVILDNIDHNAWLDPANDDARQLQAMLAPFCAIGRPRGR